ncbi:MAG TPA: FKBP-type peptidyl-prolyl cis-trans isomerase [Gammaproteobacteria bacterium]|nr:FKBP-type peptidyl-prolyl cis-trans isomerase [Gammaproteobacteria bacterium]
MDKQTLSGIILLGLAWSWSNAHALESDKEKFSYSVGVQVATSLSQAGPSLDISALTQAISDVLSGAELKLTEEEMKQAFEVYQKQLREEQAARADKNLHAGQEFLAANKKKPGVVELPNGIQYKIIRKGEGKKPTLQDSVEVHYRGTLIDGKEFDSSYKRNETVSFPVNGVIQGWQEILPLMPVGSKWEVVIPADLAYGAQGAGSSIGPNETLVFDIELIGIK